MNITEEVVGRADPVEDMTAAVVASIVKTVVTTDCGTGEIMKARKINKIFVNSNFSRFSEKFEVDMNDCRNGGKFEFERCKLRRYNAIYRSVDTNASDWLGRVKRPRRRRRRLRRSEH